MDIGVVERYKEKRDRYLINFRSGLGFLFPLWFDFHFMWLIIISTKLFSSLDTTIIKNNTLLHF